MAELEARIVRQQGAGDNRRARRTFALYDHAGGGAHDALWRPAEDAPARLGDLWDIRAGIHFRKPHQPHRFIRIDIDADLVEQCGEAAANGRFRLPGKPAAGDMYQKLVSCQPYQPVDGRLPAALSALQFVDPASVMVDRDADRQPIAIAI